MTDNQLKWLGTFTLVLGTAVNGFNIYPLGVIILTLGGIFWVIAARRANDLPLIVVNLVMMLTGMAGVAYNYLK
jgi:glucose uptake protein GlcU